MADNLAITQGSGTTVATDDVGGVHYQVVKIATGDDGKVSSDEKQTIIEVSSSGDNTIVAAVTSPSNKRIIVVDYVLTANAAVNARWKSGSGTNKSGLLYLDAKGGVSSPGSSRKIVTAAGEALVLNLSGAVAVGGHITYREEA